MKYKPHDKTETKTFRRTDTHLHLHADTHSEVILCYTVFMLLFCSFSSGFSFHRNIRHQWRNLQTKLRVKGFITTHTVYTPVHTCLFVYTCAHLSVSQWKTVCLQRLSGVNGHRQSVMAEVKGRGSTLRFSSSKREQFSRLLTGRRAEAAGCSVSCRERYTHQVLILHSTKVLIPEARINGNSICTYIL